MKRNAVAHISLAYSLLLLIISGGNFYFFFLDNNLSELLIALMTLALGGLMLVGSLFLKYRIKPGRELLMLAGVLTAPLGLIVTYLAYKARD